MTETLLDRYDTLLLDLDGVVYVGGRALPEVPERLARARRRGVGLAYVTNNASRTPQNVAERLAAMGVPAEPSEVVTSSQAAARLLSRRLPAGARVLVVGGAGLDAALRERGLEPVYAQSDHPVAVVQGFADTIGWRELAEGGYAIRAGLPWIATNVDRTLPTERGQAPGNGALVAALEVATGRTPEIAGKPERALFDETLLRTRAERPLVVGDRLDTDIDGAVRAGLPSLLVLTGVSTLEELARRPKDRWPTYVADDLGGLFVSCDDLEPAAVVAAGSVGPAGDASSSRASGEG